MDIDPQANLSDYLGFEPDGSPTMTQLVMSACMGTLTPKMTADSVWYCETADVDFIPSDINLASSETLMSTTISRETILRRILTEDFVSEYNFVIIDCLPSSGTLLINALTVSDRLLIPVQTQKFSMDGLQSLENLYQQIKTAVNPKLSLLGVPDFVNNT